MIQHQRIEALRNQNKSQQQQQRGSLQQPDEQQQIGQAQPQSEVLKRDAQRRQRQIGVPKQQKDEKQARQETTAVEGQNLIQKWIGEQQFNQSEGLTINSNLIF